MVLLSGCWSGSAVGKFGQDPFSLAVGAIIGGADTVVAGVGRIGSTPSAYVAKHMLHLINGGRAVSAALSQAQRMVRDENPGLSPYDWAGLISVGTGR